MSKFFRKANREEIVRFETPDGEDWIEVRAELSKGEVNDLLNRAPREENDTGGGLKFIELFFEKVVSRWSMIDDDDLAVPPTVQNYQELNAPAAKWIDDTLGGHLQTVIGTKVDDAEGKPSS